MCQICASSFEFNLFIAKYFLPFQYGIVLSYFSHTSVVYSKIKDASGTVTSAVKDERYATGQCYRWIT